MTELTETLRAELMKLDTPTVCNALEIVAPERRGYGYNVQPLVCTRPELPPMVGVARTASIRAQHPSDLKGAEARAMQDAYYAYVDEGPNGKRRLPKISRDELDPKVRSRARLSVVEESEDALDSAVSIDSVEA